MDGSASSMAEELEMIGRGERENIWGLGLGVTMIRCGSGPYHSLPERQPQMFRRFWFARGPQHDRWWTWVSKSPTQKICIPYSLLLKRQRDRGNQPENERPEGL